MRVFDIFFRLCKISHFMLLFGLLVFSFGWSQTLPIIAADDVTVGSAVEIAVEVTDENVIDRIIIKGAERIDERTILEYLLLQPGGAYTARVADETVKILFSTGLFANVFITRDGNDIIVNVQENPIINRIAFEGNERIDDGLLQSETSLPPRSVYSRNKVQLATQRILEIYRRRGRHAVIVEPQIIQREQNRVDLVFEIEEGAISQVKKIFFNGNEFFSDGALKDEISSREYSRWNFLASSDTYDPDRVNYDAQLLRNLYFRFGFIDFALASSVGELLEDRSGFFLTFAFQEGLRYRIGDVSLESDILEISPEAVLAELNISEGSWYNQDIMEEKRSEITDYLGSLGYAFTNIGLSLDRRPLEDGSSSGIVDLAFRIEPSAQVFVERIEINGNVRTVDSVIRREFKLVEGDPYDRTKISLSQRALERLGYFSKVGISEKQGSQVDRAIIEVDVEEQSTGSLNFGVGYSTVDGALFSIALKETNLLGRGDEISINYTKTARTDEFSIGYARPYFLGYDVRAGIQVYNLASEQDNNQRFKSKELGLKLTASYSLGTYLSQYVYYTIADRTRSGIVTIKTATGAVGSRNISEDGILSEIGHTISYDTRNSNLNPTEGYRVSFSNGLAGIGGDYEYLRTSVNGVYYTTLGRSGWVWLVGGDAANIVSLDGDNISRGDRFFLGGNNLRGFNNYGAGSRSRRYNGYALGGTTITTGTTEFRHSILPESFGVTGSIFTDVGWISGIEEDFAEARDKSIRASVGVGASVVTPLGPMRFDFAWPIKKEKYDRDRVFQFSFRSRF